MSTFKPVDTATGTPTGAPAPAALERSEAQPVPRTGSGRTPEPSGGGTGSASMVGSPSEFAKVARELFETDGVMPTLQAVVTRAVDLVPCRWAAAAMTDHLTRHPAPLSATTDAALMQHVATLSAAAGDSPGITAFESGTVISCPDLSSPRLPPRWTTYARDILQHTDIKAVLAMPLRRHETTVGVMTLYADTANAFDGAATERALVLAEHAAIAIEAARADDRADNLNTALLRSRTIGTAMGILVERLRIHPDVAFDVLRRLSQDSNRKLADIAAELVEVGTVAGLTPALPAPSTRPARSRTRARWSAYGCNAAP